MIAQKLFKPITPKTEKRFNYLRAEISNLTKQLAALNTKLKSYNKKSRAHATYRKHIAAGNEMLDNLKNKYRKEFDADVKKRTIYLSLLVHRLVAEKFCKGKSAKRSQVIHNDFNKLNNRFTNLKWASQEEITAHQKINPVVRRANRARKECEMNIQNCLNLTLLK